MKKILILLAGVTVMALGIAGCGKEEKKEGAEATESYTIINARPWDGDEYKKGFVEDITKKSGITINWDTYLHSDWDDKKSVVLSGGDLPDAFWGGSLKDADLAQNLESFIPLEEYITPEIMPNLTKALAEDPKFKAISTSADGHVYGLPGKLPGRPIVGNQLFINKKWLDNLGLEMPTTYTELEYVLKEFKEKDADGDGDPNNEIPFSGVIYRMFLPWGPAESTSSIKYMNWDGKDLYYTPVTDTYKTAITHLHDLFKQGIIDPEFFTQDWSMINAKRVDESQIGVTEGWVAGSYGKEKGEYVPLPAIEAPDGKRHVIQDVDAYNRNQFLVTKNAKNPEKLLAWVDQFYNEDASVQTFFGSFGVGTEKNDDGTYSLIRPEDGVVQDENSWNISFRDFGPKYVGENFTEKLHMFDDDGDGYKLAITKDLEEYVMPIYPALSFTNEEQMKLSNLNTDIQAFVESKMGEWVSKGNVDKEWDDYLKQLDKMGLGEFMEIQETALKRMQEEN